MHRRQSCRRHGRVVAALDTFLARVAFLVRPAAHGKRRSVLCKPSRRREGLPHPQALAARDAAASPDTRAARCAQTSLQMTSQAPTSRPERGPMRSRNKRRLKATALPAQSPESSPLTYLFSPPAARIACLILRGHPCSAIVYVLQGISALHKSRVSQESLVRLATGSCVPFGRLRRNPGRSPRNHSPRKAVLCRRRQ